MFALLVATIVIPRVRGADRPFVFVVFGQAGFADQSLADRRIDRINLVGTGFENWDQPATRFLGARLLKQVSPRWAIGVQADYGRASMRRSVVAIPPFEPPTEHLFILKQESELAALMVAGRRSL